jgi:predicted ATP-grasp superfamily ATP-dependent carboligase
MSDPAKNRLKILFTEGSSLSARQTLYCLGGRHEIDVIDPERLCLCRFSRFVRRWHKCPSYSQAPEAYLEFLFDRIRREKYDVLLPTHEQAYFISRFRDEIGAHVHIAVPSFSAMQHAQSKVEFLRLLASLNVPHPRTAVLRSLAELNREWEFPCYLKLAHGTAGNGVRLARNQAELIAAAKAFQAQGALDGRTDFLVQQPAVGDQCTVGAVFDRGRLVGAHCATTTIIGVGGGNLGRVGADHPQVVEDMTRIGAHLAWHGAMSVEYFFNAATGRHEMYECNPRIGETFNAFLSGVNLPEALVQVSIDQAVATLPKPTTGLRSHSGFMVLMHEALRGATRGDLRGIIRQIHRGEGVYYNSQDELTRPCEDWLSAIPAGWITARLLARPSVARKIVEKTVNNYSLPEAAADRIRDLPAGVGDTAASEEWDGSRPRTPVRV